MNHPRLWLYIGIGAMPEIQSWLTNTYDTSTRGVLILASKIALAALINTRAYLDSGGKTADKPATDSVKPTVSADGTPAPKV